LIAQLDPVGTAFNRLVEQQKQLNEAKAKGMLSPEMYEELSGKLRAMRSELEVTQSQLSKTGMSAKQTAFAMRMLPVFFGYNSQTENHLFSRMQTQH
ncbi:hypothetical protein Q604_UNBC14509G0001, partial [human gut metagenome]